MRARRLTMGLVASMCVMAEVLALGSASALAAAPETPETIAASGITATTAVLHGVLNPNGEGEAGEYQFRYRPGVTACEGSGEESTEPAPATGHEAEAVQASVGRLLPGTVYAFCVLARNQAFETALGAPKTFTTPTAAPVVSDVSVASVGPTEAMLTAEIDPGAEATGYQIEYGSGELTPEADLPAAKTPVRVQQKLSGLDPETVYRFRFLARNDQGSTEASGTFQTTSAATSALALPDGREYELVSGAGNPGEVYVPYGPEVAPLYNLTDTPAEFPFRASAEGDAVVYVGEPGEVGGSGKVGHGFGNQFIATRNPHGWTVSDVSPQPSTEGSERTEYQAFSSDLKIGILTESSPTFATLAQPEGPTSCDALYVRSDDEPTGANAHALFTKTYEPGFCGELIGDAFELQAQKLQFVGANAGAGTVAPNSDLLFQTPAPLTAEATRSPSGEGANLYDSNAGELRMVNVLPDGQPDPNAVFGGRRGEDMDADFDNVISADGRRIFWTDLNAGGRLYVRENPGQPQSPLGANNECTVAGDACTLALSAGEAQFWTATPDGHYVFYTEGETLWRYDTEQGSREELEGAGTAVEGVIGASDDGTYLYFVAAGALPSEADGNGQTAEARSCEFTGEESGEEALGHLPKGIGCNLYLWRAGQPLRFIASLAAWDDHYRSGSDYQGDIRNVGDWQPELGSRTAEVSPSGNELAFESTQQLTGYDNSVLDETPGGPDDGAEVFVYDAAAQPSKRLACASCSPNGAAPVRAGEGGRGSTYAPISVNPTFMRRWLSEDGSRVFFNSSQPLAAQDENDAQDVYEWEREGTGSCTTSTSRWGGCVFLLSGANSSDQSFFVDADASGNNVFFTHRGKLGQAGEADDKLNLLDARVDGGFPEVRLSCTGTGCQGVPPAAPAFATPASVTFSGVGNFLPAPPRALATKALTRAQLLAKALKACRAKHDKRRRASCETRAQKRYGPKPKATRAHVKTKRSGHR